LPVNNEIACSPFAHFPDDFRASAPCLVAQAATSALELLAAEAANHPVATTMAAVTTR
jgi:hypothetical protein